jgi:glycosyltransferase involved in cell wall biosynthesis
MKRKVGVLFTHAREQIFAPSQVHSLIVRYLNRERFSVHLACAAGIGKEKPPSLKLFETIPHLHLRPTLFGPTINGRSKIDIARSAICTGLPSIASMLGLARYIKQHNIDIIHAEYKPRDAFYGVLLAKLVGIRTVVHVHSLFADWMGWRIRWAMKQADGLIAVSQFVAQSLIAAGYPPEKVHCVHNCVDPKAWDYNTDGNSIREEFGLTPEVPLFVIAARLVPSKGYELLLEALALVRKQISDFKLLIVGGEDPNVSGLQDGQLYSSVLKKIIHKLNLDEHVMFAGHRSDIQDILAACDIFTMPSEEGFGLSLAEAMAMKKPVIGLTNGGTPEVVEHGKAGLLSRPDDVEQLAKNILTLVNNPALRTQMGEYGRERIEQYFNPQRMANDVEQVYQLVLGDMQASSK